MDVEKKTTVYPENAEWLSGFRIRFYSSLGKGRAVTADLLYKEFSADGTCIADAEGCFSAGKFPSGVNSEAIAMLCRDNSDRIIFSDGTAESGGAVFVVPGSDILGGTYVIAPTYRDGMAMLYIVLFYSDALRIDAAASGGLLCEASAAVLRAPQEKSVTVDTLSTAFVSQTDTPLYIIDKQFTIVSYNAVLKNEFENVALGDKCYAGRLWATTNSVLFAL